MAEPDSTVTTPGERPARPCSDDALAPAVGIASLATGLRLPLRAQLLVAAAVWLIMADAAFFDVDASPMSEPAALVGLLMVAAGVVYLGRGWRETVFGLALAGAGGFLAILSKEQYLILAAPVCLTLVLAGVDRGRGWGLRSWPGRFRTRQAAAAFMVAAVLAVLAGAMCCGTGPARTPRACTTCRPWI
jgi:hypothetical protein